LQRYIRPGTTSAQFDQTSRKTAWSTKSESDQAAARPRAVDMSPLNIVYQTKVFWFFFVKKNFFLKKEAKTLVPFMPQPCRCTISFLISPMAWAGLSPLGQVSAQFMIVWQR
jgi:hypothetical protein